MKVLPLIVTLSVIVMIALGATNVKDDVLVVPQRHLGLTASQWHQRAVTRTEERNATRAKLRRVQKDKALLRQSLKQTLSADLYGTHWLERAFLCIHAGEGAWTSNTGNGYYGGLQFDSSFQRTYGGEYMKLGSADKWPVSVQIAVAVKAYLSGRGFHPWPNTARVCGLIP